MAVLTREQILARLRTSDKPSQRDWEDIVDSLFDAARRAQAQEVPNGSLVPAQFANGTANRWLGTDGGGVPDWRTLPSGEPAVPTGPAGGELAGTYPNPTVAGGAIGLSKFKSSEASPVGAGAALTWNGSAFVWAIPAAPCVVVRDVKASGTQGGAFSSGAWRIRTLNTLALTHPGSATLAGNAVTLAAGTWFCHLAVPAYRVDRHKARLWNITDGSTQLVGSSSRSETDNGWNVSHSIITGMITIAAAKMFQIEHRCETSNGSDSSGQGMGVASGWSVDEVYTVGHFFKLA